MTGVDVRLAALAFALVMLAACGTQWDPPGGTWMKVSAGPLSARHDVAGAWLDGRFVLGGGWAQPPCPPNAACLPPEDPALRDGASFDPATNSWRSTADAPVPVSGRTTVVLDDKLYVLTPDSGRADSPVTFLCYDPVQDVWTTLPSPSGEGVDLVAADDVVLAVASSTEEAAVDSVFEPTRGSWRQLPPDPLGPSDVRAAVWMGDWLLLTAQGSVPEQGAERDVLELGALDATFTDWRRLPNSNIGGGYPIVVSDLVVYPFFTFTGKNDGRDAQTFPRGRDRSGHRHLADSARRTEKPRAQCVSAERRPPYVCRWSSG